MAMSQLSKSRYVWQSQKAVHVPISANLAKDCPFHTVIHFTSLHLKTFSTPTH
jgi:hypothetical protein